MANVSVAGKIAAVEEEKTQLKQDLANTSDSAERSAIRNQLAAQDQLLASYQTGYGWKQDSKALDKVDGRVFMYVNIIVINDHVTPPIECRMRALVDTAAGQELIIPSRKAQELKLLERSRGHLKAFGDGRVDVIVYSPVLVKLPSDDSNGHEQTFKQADLTVYAKDVPPDPRYGDMSTFAGFRQPLSPEGNLQLTPVKSPPRGDIATAILGMEGLRRLNVTVNPYQALLCPMESGDDRLVV